MIERCLDGPPRRPSSRLACAGIILFGVFLLGKATARLDAQPACTSAVRFDLEPQASLPDGLQGKLILRPKAGKGEPLTLEARVGAPVSAELPCASLWEVAVDFPNVWGPRRNVVADASGLPGSIRLQLWPLGRIGGSVKLAEKGERLPKKILVTTLAPRSTARKDTPRGAMDCPVDDRGKWTCPPLPATAFDLVLSAEGFIPQYRWGLNISPGKTLDVGTFTLKKGASVAGWAEVDGGAIDPKCRARLTPLVGPGGGAQTAEKVRKTAREAAVRKDGFFQIADVAPGDYSLEVRQPGFAAAEVHPVTISPRSETFLRDRIVLKRPLDLDLAISPPLDWLGRPWQVLLLQAPSQTGTFDHTVFNGKADELGNLKVPRQSPGRFKAYVSDSKDNQLAIRTFQVTGPENAAQEIRLAILTLRGTVKLGKEPLAATLWFGGHYGSSAVKMESGRDGKFHGVLPSDGWWTVDITSADPSFSTRAKVKAEPDGQDRLKADIDLPATRVYGKVVDDAGHPMPAATVSLSTDEGYVTAKSDETGCFDLRGLPEGLAYAGATLSSVEGEWSSDRVSLFLHDGEDPGPLEIRMRKEARLLGSVQSSRGPVPGAGVTVLSLRPVVMGGDSVRTEPDGSFTAHVPASTQVADVIVSSPGHALKAFPVAVGTGAAQPLMVDEPGGDLHLLLPSPGEGGKEAFSLWVFQNGLPLPPGVLVQWAAAQGRYTPGEPAKGPASMIVPALAPGEYRACLAAQGAVAAWEASGWTAPLAKCTAGTLTAGGMLQLDLAQQ